MRPLSFYKSAFILLIIHYRGFHSAFNLKETTSCKCFGGVRFDLGMFLQVETMSAQCKIDFFDLLLFLEVNNVHQTYRKG